MDIREEEFFDYIRCPAYYDMKYNRKIPCNENKTMQKLLNEVAGYFFTMLLDKKICTMNELKRRWDKVCEKNKEFIDQRKSIEGLNYIINFARWASENKIALIDYASTYDITSDQYRLIGTTKPIIAVPGKKIELLDNRFSNREPAQTDLDKKLKYTMDVYAFNQICARPIDAIKVVHFKNKKEFTTNRTANDFDRLLSTIKGVGMGIQNKAFYPRESSFCTSCELKSYCKYWC